MQRLVEKGRAVGQAVVLMRYRTVRGACPGSAAAVTATYGCALGVAEGCWMLAMVT